MLWFVQRRVTRGGTKRRETESIRVVARQGLGGKTQLVVAEIDGSRYVLGVSERTVTVIDRLPPRDILRSQPQSIPATASPDDAAPAPPLRRSRPRTSSLGTSSLATSSLGTSSLGTGPRTPSFGAEMARTLRRTIGA